MYTADPRLLMLCSLPLLAKISKVFPFIRKTCGGVRHVWHVLFVTSDFLLRETKRSQCLSQPTSLIAYGRKIRRNFQEVKTIQDKPKHLHALVEQIDLMRVCREAH